MVTAGVCAALALVAGVMLLRDVTEARAYSERMELLREVAETREQRREERRLPGGLAEWLREETEEIGEERREEAVTPETRVGSVVSVTCPNCGELMCLWFSARAPEEGVLGSWGDVQCFRCGAVWNMSERVLELWKESGV